MRDEPFPQPFQRVCRCPELIAYFAGFIRPSEHHPAAIYLTSGVFMSAGRRALQTCQGLDEFR